MTLRLPLSLLWLPCVPVMASSGSGWVSLSLTGPNNISSFDDVLYRTNNVMIGTPPSTQSPVVDISSTVLGISSRNCVFCPGKDLFDTSLSSTYQTNNQPWVTNETVISGTQAHDTFSFGGVLTSQNAPFMLIDYMSIDYSPGIADGHFGLRVDPTNETKREEHILTRLHSSDQLLNPVVGLRMGRTPETSHITIGALDPNDFDGTINWVEAETPDPSWLVPLVIRIDGFRGFNNSFLPSTPTNPNPNLVYLNSFLRGIEIPDAQTYMSQIGYRGPAVISGDLTKGYSYGCNTTDGAYAHLSVEINGVNYQIDSQGNLLESSPEDACSVYIYDNAAGSNKVVGGSLGLTFLRSVYLAYRFPTPDCPKAYYGFAFQKGANRTSSMISQQPRSTPTESSHCLSLTPPTSTPSVSTPPPQASADGFLSKNSYKVWGRPGEEQVRLRGVEYLQADIVQP